jgi:hypothetical protein
MNYIRLHEPVSFLSARAKSYAKILNQLVAIKERLAAENKEFTVQHGKICRAIIMTKQKLRGELELIAHKILSHLENNIQVGQINNDHLKFFVRSMLNIQKNIPEPFPLEIDSVKSYLESITTNFLSRPAFSLQSEIRLDRETLQRMGQLVSNTLTMERVHQSDNVIEWLGYSTEGRILA